MCFEFIEQNVHLDTILTLWMILQNTTYTSNDLVFPSSKLTPYLISLDRRKSTVSVLSL